MSTASSIQNTLSLLLPTASTLPPPLTNLASSLLAQSRVKATSLKPEEEIARTFACCHIACEQLKNRLGLEIGSVGGLGARAPCGPRVYKRLYGFLESALKDTPGTPGKRGRDEEHHGTPGPVRLVARTTGNDVKRATPASLGKRTRGISDKQEAVELPRFVMPLIRHLCAELDTLEAGTHVYAGVESVFRALQSDAEEGRGVEDSPSKERKTTGAGRGAGFGGIMDRLSKTQLPALVAAIYSHVVSVMYGADIDAHKSTEIQEAVRGHFAKQKAATFDTGLAKLNVDFDNFLRTGQTDWPHMEWHQNLPRHEENYSGTNKVNLGYGDDPVISRNGPAKTPLRRKEKHAKRPSDPHKGEDLGAAGLLPGLGTMFQPAVDWLSEDRRADLIAWKTEMHEMIAIAEQKA